MEKHNNIREKIRKIIEEIFYQGGYIPFVSTQNGQFPYNNEDITSIEPNQIIPEIELNNKAENFSKQEFELGMEIEKRVHPNSNTLELNNIITKRLGHDNKFYSKLKQPKS